MGKCIFVFFQNFFKIFLKFCLTKQLRDGTYGLETCCSYLGSIQHNYISMIKQTISKS